jgi:GH24 family phage-related lysozyme (muramidase)
MAKLSVALLAALAASASAFAPQKSAVKSTSLKATDYWDPMGLYTLGSGEAFDTFPNMFPHQQYMDAAEKKNGRMAMLGWTGVWATHKVRANLRPRRKAEFPRSRPGLPPGRQLGEVSL